MPKIFLGLIRRFRAIFVLATTELIVYLMLFVLCINAEAKTQSAAAIKSLPRLEEVLAAKMDLWGEASLKQPGGPSWEFFRGLPPPLRWVDAPFSHYPIVLSAPGRVRKGRLISNSSAVNALSGKRNWHGEIGVPVTFRIGVDQAEFGSYMLLKDDAINYSAGNQYERLYEGEGGDAAVSLMFFGQEHETSRLIVPPLNYSRKGLLFRQAGFNLQLLAHYY